MRSRLVSANNRLSWRPGASAERGSGVTLDPQKVLQQGTPEWWMTTMAARLLDRQRLIRLAVLRAYRSGCPPLPQVSASQRKGFYEFQRLSRSNFARPIINAPAHRMGIRAIRTAAADDANGDQVAWRYFTANGLDVAATDVHSDLLTFAESYVRVGVNARGVPVALRRDPWSCITMQDPLDPQTTIAAFELLWDENVGRDYAYLWLPGQQWVADRERTGRPGAFPVPGLLAADARRCGLGFMRQSFDPQSFSMRPLEDDVDEADRDGGPYSQTFSQQVVPVVRFSNRDGVGEFEEHLDLIDRINHTIMNRVVIAAIQAYKQRALQQTADGSSDRLPDKNPETGEDIQWEDVFQPGPDALWKLPPGVTIWESAETQLQGILSSITDDVKHLSADTDTPLPLLSDDTNSSADAAQLRREGLVFKVEDREMIAGRAWSKVVSFLFLFAPDADRYAGEGQQRVDRADAGQIIIVWKPAERFTLAERSQADSLNKTLSSDMAAEKIWQLTPDEVAINRAQRAADMLLNPPAVPAVPSGTAA